MIFEEVLVEKIPLALFYLPQKTIIIWKCTKLPSLPFSSLSSFFPLERKIEKERTKEKE